jgi:hypothetical protein
MTIGLNVILLVVVIILGATKGIGEDVKYVARFALFIVTPVFTLFYFFRNKAHGDGWLSLYFRRKAAEERARIRKLEAE